jgi:hypothetical protein
LQKAVYRQIDEEEKFKKNVRKTTQIW